LRGQVLTACCSNQSGAWGISSSRAPLTVSATRTPCLVGGDKGRNINLSVSLAGKPCSVGRASLSPDLP
jgi:hypothetical protein